MMILTAIKLFVSQLRSRRNQTHGGAQAADSDSDSETLSETTTWHAGQELQERAEEVDRVESTVRIIGSKREEWIEGQGVEVRR